MKAVRVRSAVTQFLEAVAGSIQPATLALYRHYLRRFVAVAGDMKMEDVTPATVSRWSSKYHPVSTVQRLFKWAKNEGRIIAINTLEGMRKHRNGHRNRILCRRDLVRLQRSSGRAFRRFVLAMIETIARPREVRAVRWGDIHVSGSPAWTPADLVAGVAFFRLTNFKGRDARRDRLAVRTIPISPRLGRLLVRLWGDGRDAEAVVLSGERGRPWTVNAVRCQFRRVRRRAGIAADVAGENVVAYSLRHTSATDAVGAGIKGFTLAELMGHSDIRMTQRYVHLRPDHLIAAANRLYEFKQGQKAKNERTGSLRRSPDDLQ